MSLVSIFISRVKLLILTLTLFCYLLIFVLSISHSHRLSWTKPSKVLNTEYNEYTPTVIFENNNSHLFWVSNYNFEDRLMYSYNFELDETLVIASNEMIRDLQIIELQGIFHILWCQGLNNFWDIFYVNGSFGEWNTPIILSESSWSESPSFCVSPFNMLHFVWSELTELSESFNSFQIYYLNYSISDNIWSESWWFSEEMVENRHLDFQMSPVIRTDHVGNLFVTWRYYYYGSSDIWLRYWNLTAWSESLPITQTYSHHVYDPNLLIDNAENLHFFYYRSKSDTLIQLFIQTYWRNVSMFGKEYLLMNISSALQYEHTFRFISDTSNKTNIAWTEFKQDKIETWWGIIDSNQLTKKQLIKETNENVFDPYLCYNEYQQLCLFFSDSSEIKSKIHFSILVEDIHTELNHTLMIPSSVIFLLIFLSLILSSFYSKYFSHSAKTVDKIINKIIKLREDINTISDHFFNFGIFKSHDPIIQFIRENIPKDKTPFEQSIIKLSSYIEWINLDEMRRELSKRNKGLPKNEYLSVSGVRMRIQRIQKTGKLNTLHRFLFLIVETEHISLDKMRNIYKIRNVSAHPNTKSLIQSYSNLGIKYRFERTNFRRAWKKMLESYASNLQEIFERLEVKLQ